MIPIFEAEEKTSSTSSEVQLTQQQLEEENKRCNNALACHKLRVKEEEERHSKQHRFLEAKLLQATAQSQDRAADDDCWLNNKSVKRTAEQKMPNKDAKALIRCRVKKPCTASKKKQGPQDERWRMECPGQASTNPSCRRQGQEGI